MNRKTKTKLVIVSLVVLIVLFSSDLSRSPSSPTHTLDTSVYHFELDNGSRVKFNEDSISFGDSSGLWSWIDDDGIMFQSLSMGSSDCPDPWTISLDNSANVTILKLFEDNVLEIELSGSTGTTTTTEVDCGSKGEPRSVEGADGYNYDTISTTMTLTTTHFSIRTIKLDWSIPTSAGFYTLKIHITQNKLPFMGASVTVDDENGTTNLLGDAVFDVEYGTHWITVLCGDDKRTRMVNVRGDETLGFNFEFHPPRGRNDLVLLSIPLVFLLGIGAFFILKKRR